MQSAEAIVKVVMQNLKLILKYPVVVDQSKDLTNVYRVLGRILGQPFDFSMQAVSSQWFEQLSLPDFTHEITLIAPDSSDTLGVFNIHAKLYELTQLRGSENYEATALELLGLIEALPTLSNAPNLMALYDTIQTTLKNDFGLQPDTGSHSL